MGWLYRTALRLVTRKRLKSERTRLLLEKSYMPKWKRQTMSTFGPGSRELARLAKQNLRISRQIDAVNAEFARRGLV